MYEKLTKCPLCQEKDFHNHMVVQDHAISKESFIICECQHCNLWFTNPRPDTKNIGKYYDSEEYISHNSKVNNLTDFIYRMVRVYTIKQKLRWINSLVPNKGRILDFGCGTGSLLKAAKHNGWKTIGYEPNQKARIIAEKDSEIVHHLKELKHHKKFDIISLFHVLEHVHELNQTVELLLEKLKKRGFLLIALPNRDSHDAMKFREYWAGLDIPRHLYHFNKSSFEVLANRHDCRIIDIKPMYFDSYYVSLLSNKYKKEPSLPKSFKDGYLSNKSAKENKMNYSSLLYILKKK